MAKWSSRFALGLSNSVPGITISQENIIYLKEEGKLLVLSLILVKTNFCTKDPGGPDMTDGCGYINKIALKALRELLQWDTTPTAIQCRIAGAKVTDTFSSVGKAEYLFSYRDFYSCILIHREIVLASLGFGCVNHKSKSNILKLKNYHLVT